MTKIIQISLVLGLCLQFLAQAAHGRSMAEALGYSPEDKILLLHADDMGMTEATNRAVQKVLDFGMVQSASIMIPAPAAQDAIENYSQYDLGIHLALNSEWPDWRWKSVAPRWKVWSLTNWFGQLWKGREAVLFLGQTCHVANELRAQIERAIEWGLNPSHLDSHMGTVLFRKSWGKEYLKLAREFEIAPMVVKWSDHLKEQLPPIIFNHLKRSARLAEESGWLLFDYVDLGIDGIELEERRQGYINRLVEMKPGVTMMFGHPSFFEENPPFPDEVITERTSDVILMTDPKIREAIEMLDIKLITWKDILDAYDWDNVFVPDI